MSLNICVDIDGTITDAYFWLKYLNEHFGFNLKAEDIVKFDICRVTGISEEQYQEFYNKHGEEMHDKAVAREFAAEILNKLDKENNIYYITARPEKFRNVTENWIEKSGFPKGKLFMLGSHNKEKKAIEVNCDIFVEDRYRNAVKLAQKGVKVLLIDSNYNRYPLIDGIKRVKDWKEIEKDIV